MTLYIVYQNICNFEKKNVNQCQFKIKIQHEMM